MSLMTEIRNFLDYSSVYYLNVENSSEHAILNFQNENLSFSVVKRRKCSILRFNTN